MGTDRDRRRRRLGHDVAGRPYPTAVAPTTDSGEAARGVETVASRSTEEEARDLLAVRRAKRGDTGAFADLIRTNDDDVRSLLHALAGDDELDALCTRVYLRAFRGLPIAPVTSPRIWLLGIADGAARDRMRRLRQHGEPVPDSLATPIPADLPDDERLVLAAVEAVGLTPRETARLVGGGVEKVHALLDTARRRPEVTLPLAPTAGHGQRFWDDLGRRLLVEQSAPAASTPREPTGTGTATASVPSGRSSDIARGMAVRVHQQHPRTFPWRTVATVLAGVVTVAVLVGVALSVAGRASQRDVGLGDTASKTLNRLDVALARNRVVRGTVRVTSADDTVLRDGTYRFVRSDTGSWRITASDGTLDDGYDIPSATAATVVRPSPDAPVTATRRTGVAPGPPEPSAATDQSPGDVLADVIRAVRRGSTGTVANRTEPVEGVTTIAGTPTTEGRPVWVVTSRLDETPEQAVLAGSGALGLVHADEAELVADQSLALPTRLTLRRDGRVVATVRFSNLSISQQPAGSSYAPTIPAGVTATTEAAGFVPLEAGQLTGDAAGGALTPSFLPGGYVLTAAATDRDSHATVVCYRNGSRQLVLTRRPAPAGRPITTDPFAADGADGTKPSASTVESGALAGQTAYTATAPIRHVWVNSTDAQVVAAGDPPTAQLSKVLASLR